MVARKKAFDLEQYTETFDPSSVSLPMNRIPDLLSITTLEVLEHDFHQYNSFVYRFKLCNCIIFVIHMKYTHIFVGRARGFAKHSTWSLWANARR